ncbi:MAG: hypothetical protein QNJ31_07875 [Candidatus Caenarcaniphilales bacterium]|nr:hypothetical protein [Candidatus Caenarcaniphilales bacterium]
MSDGIPVDAEGSTRNKNYGPQDHLLHLLKVGHQPDSVIIKNFVQEHNLYDFFENLPQKKDQKDN